MIFVILGILLHGPFTLYDVHKRFTGSISLFYAASFGSIQRALGQAAERGWVIAQNTTDSARRRKPYTLTDAGREAWREWMLSPITGSDTEPSMLAKVYFAGSLPPVDRKRCFAALHQRMDDDADALKKLAEALENTAPPEGFVDIYRFRRATLDYGLRSHELAQHWLRELSESADTKEAPA